MRWLKFLAGALTLAAGLSAPVIPAEPPAAIQLSGVSNGIDAGDGQDQAAAKSRLRIAELNLRATIAGPLADVELDLLIASNAQDQDAADEARLGIILPPDAVITGYALNVGQQMIPGQLLEQAKARNVYEDEVRKGIDPGLAEVSPQNRFSTQVYPVTPSQPRRVRIRFSAPFDPARGLALPLDTDLPVGRARVQLNAQGFAAQPVLRFAGTELQMRREGATWLGEAGADGSRLNGGLQIGGTLPTGQMLVTRHANGRRFFAITGKADQAAPARTGGRLRIYWDRSRSHGGKAAADETEALVALVEATRPEAIDLVTFASNAPQMTTLENGAALRTALAKVTYRGATSLAGLDALDLPEARRCVLVSDGQVTIDRTAPFRPDCQLSTLSADTGADGARLGRIAQRQSGQFVRIAPSKGREAASALAETGASVVSVTSEAASRIGWRSFQLSDGGWLVVGELPFDTGTPSPQTINVRVAGPSGRSTEQAYSPDGAAVPLDAAGALWAGARVAEMGDDPEVHDEMVALARTFQVAGPAMSFLVLEQPEQYLEAEIAPPAGFPEDWLEQYREAKADRATENRDEGADRLAEVVRRWSARKTWWNTAFTPGMRRGKSIGGQDQRVAEVAPPPPPPPPPPAAVPPPLQAPAPPPARAREAGYVDDDADQNIVVTAQRRVSPSMASATPVTTVSSQAVNAKVEVKLESVLADRPYLKALDAAALDTQQAVLADQEAQFGSVPAFYFDTAEWFRLKGDKATARELLLSALELPASNDETLQILVFRLERDGELDLAVQLAERFAAATRDRPQPQRMLALTLAARGQARGKAGRADLERAFALLTEVALSPDRFDDDFEGLEVIALMEANALIPRIEALGGKWKLDQRLVGLLDTDARIVIEWTADDADIDLWVDEPGGERVMYSNRLSAAGGTISNDMTDGYGPEEYVIRRAPRGEYAVRVNGFDADRINPNGPGHVLVRLIRNFGRRGQQVTLADVDLGFQSGGNRNAEEGAIKVAVMKVD